MSWRRNRNMDHNVLRDASEFEDRSIKDSDCRELKFNPSTLLCPLCKDYMIIVTDDLMSCRCSLNMTYVIPTVMCVVK